MLNIFRISCCVFFLGGCLPALEIVEDAKHKKQPVPGEINEDKTTTVSSEANELKIRQQVAIQIIEGEM